MNAYHSLHWCAQESFVCFYKGCVYMMGVTNIGHSICQDASLKVWVPPDAPDRQTDRHSIQEQLQVCLLSSLEAFVLCFPSHISNYSCVWT